jgi:excisionase family DNA binding protein
MKTQMQTNIGSSENLLSRKQAAQRLGLSIRNLTYRIKDGSIPYVRLGRLIKIIPSDLDRYIQSHRIGGANE